MALAPIERVALTDRSPAVRVAAVRALAGRKDLRSVDTLVSASDDRFASVRMAALTALGNFSLGPVRGLLARRLADRDLAVPERAAALAALLQHGTRQAHADLVAISGRLAADDHMGDAIHEAAAKPEPCPTCLEPDRAQLINELFARDSAQRTLAAEQLSDLPVPLSDRLSLYQVALADEEPSVRRAAVTELVDDAREHDSALPLLAATATGSGDPEVRRPAMRALAADPRPAASKALGASAHDSRRAVAERAVVLLKVREDDDATDALIDAVGHPLEAVALRAVGAVYDRTTAPEDKRRAIDAALAHQARGVVAAGLLGVSNETAAIHTDGLVRAAKRADLTAKTLTRVSQLLAASPAPAARDALVELAGHEHRTVRAAAVTRLGQRPEPEAAAALRQLIDGDDKPTARLARRVLSERGAELTVAELTALLAEDPETALLLVARQKNPSTLDSLLPVIVAALAHADVAVSKAALQELVRKPQPPNAVLIASIVEGIENNPNAAARELMYRYLVAWGPRSLDRVQRRLAANASLPAEIRTHALAAVAAREPADLAVVDEATSEVAVAAETVAAAEAAEGNAATAPVTDLVPELEKPDVPWDGRWPLIMSMAALGSVAFGTVAEIAELETGPKAAIYGVGGVLGGATPFLLTMDRDVSMGQAMYVTSHTAWAAALGWRGSHLLNLNEVTGRPGLERGLGILGAVGGVALASWRAEKANWSGRDAAFANFTAVQAGLATKSIGMLADSGNPDHHGGRLTSLAVVGAWGLGLMPATLFNEQLEFSEEDYYLLATTMGIGTFTGAWAGLSADDGVVTGAAQKIGVGAVAGQSLGYLAGVALAPALDLSPRTSGRLLLQAGIGASLGLGLAMTMPPPEVPDLGNLGLAINLGTLTGLAAGVALPHVLDFAPGKRGMLALSIGYGATAGAFLPLLDANYGGEATRHLGGALLGGTAGLMIGSAFAPLVDPSNNGLGVAAGTTALFASTGLGVGLLSCNWAEECPGRQRLTAAAQLGAAAGVLTAAFLGDRIPANARATSNLAAGTLWGAWNGALLTRLDLDAPASVLAGGSMVLGSVAGGVTYLASDALGLPPWAGWAGLGGWLAGNAWGASLAYTIPETSERTRLVLTLTGPLALGAVAGMLTPLYSTPPPVRGRTLALGGMLGGWHTAMLAFTLEPDAPGRLERGSAGAAFGALSGAGLAYALSTALDDDDFTELAVVSAGGNLAGLGLGLVRGSDTALSMQLLGLGGMALGGVAAPFTEYEPRDAGWLLANGALLGGWNGLLIGGRLVHTDEGIRFMRESEMGGGLLLGAAGGALALAMASQWAPTPELGDMGEVVLASGLGNVLGLGVALSLDQVELTPYLAGGGLGLAVLANIWAPHTRFDTHDGLWIAGGAALGAWHGALWQGHPGRSRDTTRSWGGAGTGLALGALTTGVLSQLGDRTPGDVAEIGFAAAAGNVLALGVSNLALAAGSGLDADLLRGRLSLGLGAGLAAAATALAPYTTYDGDAWLWTLTATGLGAWHGSLIAGTPGAWSDARVASGAAFTGAAAGALAGATLSQWYRPTPADTAEALTAMAAGNLFGLGAGLGMRPADSRLQGHLMLGAGLGGLVAGTVLAPRTSYRGPDYGLAAAFTILGGWHGLLWTGAPGSDDFRPRRAVGGALVGGSLGLLSAAVLSQHRPMHGADITEILLAAGLGNSLALGASDLAFGWGGDGSPGTVRGRASLATGLALTALATGLAPHTDYSGDDILWTGSLGLVGGWTGALFGNFSDGQLSRGGALAGGSLGVLTGAVLSQWIERTPADTGEALIYAALGNTTGLGLGLMAADGARSRTSLMQGLGLGGLVVGNLLAPHTDFDGHDILWASGLGVAGAWSGALSSGLAFDDRDLAAGGALLGGSLGLLGGAALSQWIDRTPADVGEMLLYSTLGNTTGLGLGLVSLDDEDHRAHLMQGLGLGGLVAGAVLAPHTDFDGDDAPLFVLAAGTGAATGLFLPGVWGGDERGGATMLGTSLGMLTAAGLSQRFELRWSETVEAGVAYAGGSAFGYGLGGLIDGEGSELRTGLQLGAAALATSAAVALGEHTRYTATDLGFGALGLAIGVWHGQLGGKRTSTILDLPPDDHAKPSRVHFGSFMTGGLGVLTAMTLAQFIEYQPLDLVEIGGAAVVGNLIGLGVGFSLTSDDGTARAWAQHVAGVGLATTAAFLAPQTRYRLADASTLTLGAALGAGLGAWMPGAWSADSRQRAGGALTGAGVGLVAGAVAVQWIDMEPTEAAAIAGGATTLALMADGSMRLVLGDVSNTTQTQAALATTAALGAGLAIAAPHLSLERIDPVAVPFGAVVGGLLGSWLPRMIPGPHDNHRMWSGIQFGVPAGALAFALASPHLDRNGWDYGEVALATGFGNIAGLAGGCVLSDGDCFDADNSAPAWGAELLGLGAMGLALAVAPSTSYQGRDYLFMGAASATGALTGGRLAHLYRDGAAEGAVLGASVGLLGGAALSQWLRLDVADTAETLAASGMALFFVDGVAGLLSDEPFTGETRTLSSSLAGLAAFGGMSLLADSTNYSGSDWGLMTLSTGLGAWTGSRLTVFVEDESSASDHGRGALLGGILGGFSGMMMAQYLEVDTPTLLFATGGAVAGNVLGWSLGQMGNTPNARRDLGALGMTLGGVGLAIGGGLIGDQLSIGASNAGMISLVGAMGAWHGAWLPRTWTDTPVDDVARNQALGGGLLGAGIGLITGTVYANHLEYSPGDIAESTMAAVAANSFGAGLGLLLSDDHRVAVGLMEGFGVLGTLLMAGAAPHTEFDGNDWMLGALTTSLGVWQGVGTARLFEEQDAEDIAGAIMVTTSVGGVAGALLSQQLELTLAETLAGFSGTLWGAWLGAWTAVVYEDSLGADVAGVSAVGSDIGLMLSALAVSRLVDMPPEQIGYINLFGVGGALTGAAVGAMLAGDKNIQTGTLYGTAAALVTGTALTYAFGWGSAPASAPVAETPATGVSSSWGLPDWLPEIELAMPTVGPPPPADPDWPQVEAGFFLGVQGIYK